jgi:hypothetical protein
MLPVRLAPSYFTQDIGAAGLAKAFELDQGSVSYNGHGEGDVRFTILASNVIYAPRRKKSYIVYCAS